MLPFFNEIEGTIYYAFYVWFVDTQSGELIAHHWQPVAFYCDAIELNNFEIDTARYQQNNESLTFGVGTNFAPHSNNVSFSEQQINLYEQQIEKVENHQLLNLIN